jgi:hypothetical protein
VEFVNTGNTVEGVVHWDAITKGKCVDPKAPTRYGVGYLDDTPCKHPAHRHWDKMLARSYTGEYGGAYDNTEVCEGWLSFRTFSKWYEKNNYGEELLELDKDIKGGDSNIYSPQTCLLVPKRLNVLFSGSKGNSTGLPKGVWKTPNGKYTGKVSGVSYGTHNTAAEAREAYLQLKRRVVRNQVNYEYSEGSIPEEIRLACLDAVDTYPF